MAASHQEEEVLGKAYDARLMRRLLRLPACPTGRRCSLALAAIVGASMLQLAQPYLMKVAIDEHIARRQHGGPGAARPRVPRPCSSAASLLEYLQTWTLQNTGQRIMFDMRMQIYGHLQRIDVQYSTATRSAG